VTINTVTINRTDLLAALDHFERTLADDPTAAVSLSTISPKQTQRAQYGGTG
jgi:hypothetical protein